MRLRQTQGEHALFASIQHCHISVECAWLVARSPGHALALHHYSLLIAVQFKSNSPKFWNTWSEHKFHAQSYDLSFVGICKQRFKFNIEYADPSWLNSKFTLARSRSSRQARRLEHSNAETSERICS